MKKEDLLHHCRFYKGEKTNPNPEGNSALFWDYERVWIQEMTKPSMQSDFISDCISEYVGIGLGDFEKTDDTPLSLKAVLFNRYCHWNSGSTLDCVEPFKEFYINDYIKEKATD